MTKKNRQRKTPNKKIPPSSITGVPTPISSLLTPPDVSCCVEAPLPVLVTTDELCKLLSLSRSSVERAVRGCQIPGRVVIGRQVRFHLPTVSAWLHDLANKPT